MTKHTEIIRDGNMSVRTGDKIQITKLRRQFIRPKDESFDVYPNGKDYNKTVKKKNVVYGRQKYDIDDKKMVKMVVFDDGTEIRADELVDNLKKDAEIFRGETDEGFTIYEKV